MNKQVQASDIDKAVKAGPVASLAHANVFNKGSATQLVTLPGASPGASWVLNAPVFPSVAKLPSGKAALAQSLLQRPCLRGIRCRA